MREIKHKVDICVIGGGISGICVALSAVRRGVTVALLNDRPVLGGASSSESRMHICGADRHNSIPNMRETGILEELRLENLMRNPHRNFSIWDTILYDKVKFQSNMQLFLNTSCMSAEMKGDSIKEITGWQITTQTFHKIESKIYVDCSGDGILASLSGALYRIGREGKDEYNESLAPEHADNKTMGLTCLFKAVDTGKLEVFEPLPWAYTYRKEEDLPFGAEGHRWLDMGYWWIESGGEYDTIHDAEKIRDELLKIVYGIWDHIKNYCVNKEKSKTWTLDWIQFLPTKRESVRYIGDYILTQNDILSDRHFHDTVCYGGWPIDDHEPGGFNSMSFKKNPNVVVNTPSPYSIPYRIFYSSNIRNLMFSGRCISCSHIAFSSTRVMGTCAAGAQAVGTAAAIAISTNLSPREAGISEIIHLQQSLLKDDVYLPDVRQIFSYLTTESSLKSSSGNPESLRDGVSRPIGGKTHRWDCSVGDNVWYLFIEKCFLKSVTIVFDSALSSLITMSWLQKDDQITSPPPELVKKFHISLYDGQKWHTVYRNTNNYQRLQYIQLGVETQGVRLTIDATWGNKKTGLYAFYCS